MNPLYPRLEKQTVVKMIRRFGQKCRVLSATDTGYNPSGAPTPGKESLCLVCNEKNKLLDGENPIKLEYGAVKILLISRVKPEKGGSIYANDRYYRIFYVEEVNPAGLAVLYKAYATDKDQAKLQLYPVDLNRTAEIYMRSMHGLLPDEIGQTTNRLTLLNHVPCAIETKAAYQQSSCINLDAKVTHVIWCRSVDIDAAIANPFDTKRHLICVDGEHYRVQSIENPQEAGLTRAVYVQKE